MRDEESIQYNGGRFRVIEHQLICVLGIGYPTTRAKAQRAPSSEQIKKVLFASLAAWREKLY